MSPRGRGPLAIAREGSVTPRAARCPNAGVLLGNGPRQVLGAEALSLLLAALRGDAMEPDVPLGTAELRRGVDWAACIRGWEGFFCLSRRWQGSSRFGDAFPAQREGASCCLGGDAAGIREGEISAPARKGAER